MNNTFIMSAFKSLNFSPHFTAYELIHSNTADTHGISNVPEQDYIYANLRLVCEFLEMFRARVGYPLVINSGYRNEYTNKLVHGVSNSLHLEGLAADVNLGRVPAHVYEAAFSLAKKEFKEKHDNCVVTYEMHPSRGYMHIQLKKK